jgi:hypothetical protein
MTELITRMFQRVTPFQEAVRELEMAQSELLKSESLAEYATNMVRYHEQRIARLKRRVSQYREDIE